MEIEQLLCLLTFEYLAFIIEFFQESSMFCLRVLDVEEGVVGTSEESTGLLIVVIREGVGGIGVSSCIKLGRRSGS